MLKIVKFDYFEPPFFFFFFHSSRCFTFFFFFLETWTVNRHICLFTVHISTIFFSLPSFSHSSLSPIEKDENKICLLSRRSHFSTPTPRSNRASQSSGIEWGRPWRPRCWCCLRAPTHWPPRTLCHSRRLEEEKEKKKKRLKNNI
jgi:hypothetical protein